MPILAPGARGAESEVDLLTASRVSSWGWRPAKARRIGSGGRARIPAAAEHPVFQREQSGREQSRVLRAGLADGEGCDRHAAGHLRDRQQAVEPLERAAFDGDPEDRKYGHRRGHAGQVRGAAGAGDDRLEAARFRRSWRSDRAARGCDGRTRHGPRSGCRVHPARPPHASSVGQSDLLPMMMPMRGADVLAGIREGLSFAWNRRSRATRGSNRL